MIDLINERNGTNEQITAKYNLLGPGEVEQGEESEEGEEGEEDEESEEDEEGEESSGEGLMIGGKLSLIEEEYMKKIIHPKTIKSLGNNLYLFTF